MASREKPSLAGEREPSRGKPAQTIGVASGSTDPLLYMASVAEPITAANIWNNILFRDASQTNATGVTSASHVANDLSSVPADQEDEAEFAITGYRRSDPTVLWADTMPTAIAPPEDRYPASRLLGNGFLSLLFSSDLPSSNGISFVEPDAPSTLPTELLDYLEGKQERIKKHAEGDAWRARHAADVVRHHEEQLFSRRAEEGDWGLKGWHMSGEYHGQPNCGKGKGVAFGGRGGRGGGGRGGRGRGRGGAGVPGEMRQGSLRGSVVEG